MCVARSGTDTVRCNSPAFQRCQRVGNSLIAVGELLIEFFRATPVLVQLLWVNYVWPELFGWPNTFFAAACVALALQSSGYLAETFRGAIEAIPRGHLEAAAALGL